MSDYSRRQFLQASSVFVPAGLSSLSTLALLSPGAALAQPTGAGVMPEPYPSAWLPAGIRSRFVDDINGLRIHVLEAGYESSGRPALLLLHDFPELDHYDDLDDVAALTTALDLVISVSTAVAAISAGVGTPTKLALWRQSPWNNILLTPTGPFIERYERNSGEPWNDVFTNIARDIRLD